MYTHSLRAGKTTLSLTAGPSFTSGCLEMRVGSTVLKKLDVRLKKTDKLATLKRRKLSNFVYVPLDAQPEQCLRPLCVLKTPFNEVAAISVEGERKYNTCKLTLVFDILCLTLWKWRRQRRDVLAKNQPQAAAVPPKITVVVEANALGVNLDGGDGAFVQKSVQYTRDGENSYLTEIATPATKEGETAIVADGSAIHCGFCVGTYIVIQKRVGKNFMAEIYNGWHTQVLDAGDPSSSDGDDIRHLCTAFISSGNERVRAELLRLGRPALPFIAELLRPQTVFGDEGRRKLVRVAALEMLGQSRDPDVLNDLFWAMMDPCRDVRLLALKQIMGFGLAATRWVLLIGLTHVDDEIRIQCADALKPLRAEPEVRQKLLQCMAFFPKTAKHLADVAFS
ncbi:MAG: HEAT repeat domain-containing protein [Planctomyces sp.]